MKHIYFILLISLGWYAIPAAADYTLTSTHDGVELHMLYGSTIIHEPAIIEILGHPAFERLKEINQYGVIHYMDNPPPYSYSRYEHSLGVFFILRMFGAELDEQAAGLLHDVSHTAFSHVGDLVFNASLKTKSYQDTIHSWYLRQSGLADILIRYGLNLVCTADKEAWAMLSQPSPYLCADRIEYNIKGALLEEMISQDDAQRIMQSLRFNGERWYFTTQETAALFGAISLALTEHMWCSDWNLFIYHHAAQALQRALSIELITIEDLQFSTDNHVWSKLLASDDPIIIACVRTIINHHNRYRQGSVQEYDLHLTNRFRGIDPLVMVNGTLQPLSTIDPTFCAEFQRVATLANTGCYIKLITA